MVDEATIGVLYPGEMGAALSAALCARGVSVVTTLCGRSCRTAEHARATGILTLDSLADVVRRSRVVISVVSPAAARDLAAKYCRYAHLAPTGAIYADANSVAPEVAESLAAEMSRHGIDFVDAAINGLAANLSTGGTLFLSGECADEVARFFDGAIRTRVLGNQPGRASAMKMLLSGVSKGLCALYMELALLANRRGLSPEFPEELSRIYPGVAAVVNRMLPTYARHAARRATEMNELVDTARAADVEPCVIAAVCQLHQALAASVDAHAGAPTAQSLIEQLADAELPAAVSATAPYDRPL